MTPHPWALMLSLVLMSSTFCSGLHRIYEVQASTRDEFDALMRLQDQGQIDFWHSPASPTVKADVMVAEGGADAAAFHELLERTAIKSRVLVPDLAKFAAQKETDIFVKSRNASKWLRADAPSRGRHSSFGLQMGEYHSYADIISFMERIERQLPAGSVALRSIGHSVENRDIRGIQFGRPRNRARKVVWIDAGFHSREWTAIHTAVYFIQHIANELMNGADRSVLARYLDVIDVLIFPCLNPDGYEYTRTDPTNPSIRFWRKNRGPERCGYLNGVQTDQNRRCCRGVDLNRNFDFRFAETGTSFFPCSEIFHGTGPFSEPETQAVRDAVQSSDLNGRLEAFVDMHAYSQLWIYPFSHKKFSYPADIDELKAVAGRAVSAIGEKFGTSYMYGTGPEIIYAYAGGSTDWAKQTAKIKYTYTIELRPSYWSWNGFILEKAQLIPTARETFDGIMVLLETIVKRVGLTSPKSSVEQTIIRPPLTTRAPLSASNDFQSAAPAVTVPTTIMMTVPRCENASPYCGLWLQNNAALCQLSRANMKRNCALSCGYCV